MVMMRVVLSRLNCGLGARNTPIVAIVIRLLEISISAGNVICSDENGYNGFKFYTLIVI
jgi:hypothetical protein